MKTRSLAKPDKHLLASMKFICLLGLCLIGPVLTYQPASSLAQAFTATPTATATDRFLTPSPTWTPTITPTSIPTLTSPLNERTAITSANADQISNFRSWPVTGDGFTSLSFSPDNAYFISTGNASEETEAVRFWNIQGQDVISAENTLEDFPRTSSAIYARFSSDGQRFISVLNDTRVGIWDVQNQALIARFSQYNASMATFAHDNTVLLVAGGYQVALWSIPAGIPNPNEMPSPPVEQSFDPIGALITAVQMDEIVIDIAFDPTTYQGFVLTEDGTLYRYTYPEMRAQLEAIPQEPQPDASQPAFSEMALDITNHRVAYAGSHNDVIVYDYLNNQTLARFPLDVPISCIAYNSTGDLLVFGDWAVESSLRIVSTSNWEIITQVNTGKMSGRCAFSPDNTLIATGSLDGTLSLWEVPSSDTNE